MEVDEHIYIAQELDKGRKDKIVHRNERFSNEDKRAIYFKKKFIELGLEANDSPPNSPVLTKHDQTIADDLNKNSPDIIAKDSNSSVSSSCVSSPSSILNEDSDDNNNDEFSVENEENTNSSVGRLRNKSDISINKVSLVSKHTNLMDASRVSIYAQGIKLMKSEKKVPQISLMNSFNSIHDSPKKSQPIPFIKNKSIKRKIESFDSNPISLLVHSNGQRTDKLDVNFKELSKRKYLKLEKEKLSTLEYNKNGSNNSEDKSIDSNISKDSGSTTFKPKVSSNKVKTLKSPSRQRSNRCKTPVKSNLKLKSQSSHNPENILDQVTAAFVEQLSQFNLNELTPFQTSQLNKVLEKQEIHANLIENNDHSNSGVDNFQRESSSTSCETSNRLSVDTDDMLPIQAEVVMSDLSDSGLNEGDDVKNESKDFRTMDEVEKYIHSFINCSSKGSVVEYPPLNNEIPKDGSNLNSWQLEKVSLPPFTPFVPPPPWLRFTIPSEGYKCYSCGDTFFIESCLVQHKERRSIWISFECAPCDTKLTFYNKCTFKDHIREHLENGEHVDEDGVFIRTLPLQLTKLLQPIMVPVPQSLKPMKVHNKVTPKSLKKATISTGSENSGKENHPKKDSSSEEKNKNSELNSFDMTMVLPTKRNVRCYLCERMFHNVRELMSHMRTDQSSSDQRVECRKCLLVLPSVCAAKAHILTHPPANSSNISVCPECGSRCDGPRDFVHHLNTCGHQYRRSGILCEQCQVCFFKFGEDFINHWIKEHCSKSYECVVCSSTFESLIFHKCSSPGQQVFATFKCLLTCPMCPYVVQLHTQEEKETQDKIRSHLLETHPSVINRVHYVYKSKFCTNAFRSKDELRAHHDREHRRDNHYRTKTCTLHHEVLGHQHQYFNGQEPRNAFITMSVILSPEEIQEAQTRDVPTVSSVIDKTLFPDAPMTLETLKGLKEREKHREVDKHSRDSSPPKKDMDLIESLRPCVCFRCGYTYTGSKDFRRHRRTCEGESAVRLCQVCGVSAVGEEFSRHCLSHISEGLILCMYCNCSQFSNTQMLQQHFELHVHEQFSYPTVCPFCMFSMPDVGTALIHLQEEHDPHSSPTTKESLDAECDRCGRKFHGERGLNVHLTKCNGGIGSLNHNVSAGRQCHVCKKALTPEMYGKHIISHLEEGLLVCSLCDGLTLPSSMALLHHLEEHSSTLHYPSICPLCSFNMPNSTEALVHLKEDHGFGNLSCSSCEMHYTFTYQLQRHIDIVHKVCLYAKRRYICWICRAYDHVKKETLMNHFRMVHGLTMQEVDEKVMIRTRGQGTMPTSQFIPTKPLGSKELSSSKNDSKNEGDGHKSKISKLSLSGTNQSKGKNLEAAVEHTLSQPDNVNKGTENMEINLENIVIKKELLDVISRLSDTEDQILPTSRNAETKTKIKPEIQTPPTSTMELIVPETKEKIIPKISSKGGRKILIRNKDLRLKEKTKVLVKRLPESVLSHKSYEKKRTEGKHSFRLITKKKKKFKLHKCKLCSYSTNSKDKFLHHSKKHEENSEEDGFVCSECGQSFVVEPSLKRHMFFAHKIKQKPQPTVSKTQEYTVEIGKNVCSKYSQKLGSRSLRSKQDQHQKITIKIKNPPPETENEETFEDEKVSELQCCVCKEEFSTSVKLYSHLRTHGMAFLKLGRKKRNFIPEKTSVKC